MEFIKKDVIVVNSTEEWPLIGVEWKKLFEPPSSLRGKIKVFVAFVVCFIFTGIDCTSNLIGVKLSPIGLRLFIMCNFLFQVLTEPKNALGKQYKKLFSMNNVSALVLQLIFHSFTRYFS